MRENGTLFWLLSDQLGSAAVVVHASGTVTWLTLDAGAQSVAGTLGMEATVAAGTAGAAAPTRTLDAFSRAAEFGVRSASELHKLTAGLGVEVHHLSEVRFAERLGLDPGRMLSIVLTAEEHQMLTQAWRDAIAYSNSAQAVRTETAMLDDIWVAAQRVYAAYPELLEAARRILFGE